MNNNKSVNPTLVLEKEDEHGHHVYRHHPSERPTRPRDHLSRRFKSFNNQYQYLEQTRPDIRIDVFAMLRLLGNLPSFAMENIHQEGEEPPVMAPCDVTSSLDLIPIFDLLDNDLYIHRVI